MVAIVQKFGTERIGELQRAAARLLSSYPSKFLTAYNTIVPLQPLAALTFQAGDAVFVDLRDVQKPRRAFGYVADKSLKVLLGVLQIMHIAGEQFQTLGKCLQPFVNRHCRFPAATGT